MDKSKILAYNLVKRMRHAETRGEKFSNLEISKWIEEINIEKKLDLNL